LLVSFAVVLAGALLFTNAVEWAGHKLNLGEGAVGSVLAAVGTATPAYVFYVRSTLRGGGDVQGEETLDPLLFDRRVERRSDPALGLCLLQLLVGLGAMVGGAHLFVEQLLSIADGLGVDALVLALVLAPLATELPEKVNSFFWVREGKDALALGNISGAMVFQSTIPVGIGLLFTGGALDGNAVLSICLGVAGSLIAYLSLHRGNRFRLPAVLTWFALYSAFLVVVVAGA
jgi:cation:H+ antiporter